MRFRAAIVAIAPAVLFVALAYHPPLPGRQPNVEALAGAVNADVTRWGLSHLAIGVASGLLVLAFLAIHGYLRAHGEERWSALALPFIVMGSTLFTMLPAMEFAPLAAAKTGGDVQAAQAALQPWFVPILVIGSISFACGVVGFAKGIARSGVLGRRRTRLVITALVIMATARFIPFTAAQLYVQGAAGIAALWPLAHQMATHTQTRPAERPQPLPAT
jgi:hypothetical protein